MKLVTRYFNDSIGANLYRGPNPLDLNLIKDKVQHIENLQSGFFDAFYNTKYETQHEDDFGMKIYHSRLSDFKAPTKDQLLEITARIRKALESGKNVLVHCKHGVDRTGLVIATYRIVYECWSYDRAVDELYAEGFHKMPYFLWPKVLKELK